MNCKTTAERQAAFLHILSQTGHAGRAMEAVGLSRGTVYEWRKDPEFAVKWNDARAAAATLLEDAALERAVEGVEKPVFYKGDQVGTVREYSDALLGLLLRANDPDKYGGERRKVEITGRDGEPLIPNMSVEQLEDKVKEMIDRARARRLAHEQAVEIAQIAHVVDVETEEEPLV